MIEYRPMILPAIPDHWKAALQAATPERGFPPFIAGGALRDLLLGRKPKDVDICVGRRFKAGEFLERLPGSSIGLGGPGSCVDSEDSTLLDVVSIRYQETNFEMMVREPNFGPRQRIALHDFGIVKVAWDADGWCFHNDFVEDMQQRIFRVRSARTPMSTWMRAGRFSHRFQGFGYDLSMLEGKVDGVTVGPLRGTW